MWHFTITYKVNVPNILWNSVYGQCRKTLQYNCKTIMCCTQKRVCDMCSRMKRILDYMCFEKLKTLKKPHFR